MNPKNDSLDNFIGHVRRHAVQYLGLAHINCRFNTPESIPAHHLSAEARRNLFLVVKEALHNIVKHSSATEVSIIVTLSGNALEILLEDNGRGFKRDERVTSGNGLTNMKKRVEDIGGTFAIESETNHGTRVALAATLAPTAQRTG